MIRNVCICILGIILMVFFSSVFVVEEGHKGIILRFGKVLRDKNNDPWIYNPGLHFKVPFIETIKVLDTRIQTMENQADRFVTMEKKDLIIDSYIKWCISDLSRYYLATGGGDVSQAEVLIKRKFSDRLRSELGKLDVQGIVTDSRNRLMTDVRISLNNGTSGEEAEDLQDSDVSSNNVNYDIEQFRTTSPSGVDHSSFYDGIIYPNSMTALGIKIIDVRIKQINLPVEVSDAIYQRMRAEREAVARRHRSQGREEAEKLRAAADYEVIRILSEAKCRALITRGEADSETAKLYAVTFNKDPLFYSLIRTLRAYESSFGKGNDLMVLSSEADFFRFMKLSKDILLQ